MFGSAIFGTTEFAGILGGETVLPPIPPTDNPYCRLETVYSRIDDAYTKIANPYSRFPNVCH